jgi:formylglycine-generating enzyme required for sulfatase activity
MSRARLACVLFCFAGCAPEAPPPLGEALIIVDTDLDVPTLVNRLRVDVYTSDGTSWYESREIGRVDPSDWPASFSVFDPDENAPRDLLVRLRVFPQGVVRDYRGERYAARPTDGPLSALVPDGPVPKGETPRLVDANGIDRTPLTEPAPLTAVDRLLLVHLEPGKRGAIRVVMRGRCAGTMADLRSRATCIDQENVITPVQESVLDPDLTLPTKSVTGTLAPYAPCRADVRPATQAADGTPLFDDEVCVPGGAFLFGNQDTAGRDYFADLPARFAILAPFRMDRYEVTVARWRAVVASGFKSPDSSPLANDAALADGFPKECSFSNTNQKRETFPVTCLTTMAARAFCQFLGGDLPTEAQFEYVAEVAGRKARTRYPWGDTDPTCDSVGYGRDNLFSEQGSVCRVGSNWGPASVDRYTGDVSLGLGIVGLAGNVGELARDGFESLQSVCWVINGLDDPWCNDDKSTSNLTSVRGGHWASPIYSTRNGWRDYVDQPDSRAGFRCVREVP